MMYDEFRPQRNRVALGDPDEDEQFRRSLMDQLGNEEEPLRPPVSAPSSAPEPRFSTQVEREPIGPPEIEPPEDRTGADERITYPEDPTRDQDESPVEGVTPAPPGETARTEEGELPPDTYTAAGAMARGEGGQYRDYLEGFNFDKLDHPDRFTDADTAKYKFARIAEHYDPNDPEALASIVAELNAEGVNAQWNGKDKVDFGDGYGYIDVWEDWRGEGQGGRAWWWGAGDTGTGGGGGGEGGGGFEGGEGPSSAGDAFGYLQSLVGPNAGKDEMEAAIAAAFGNVPGFEEAYKESVKINGVWYDMVVGYDPGRGGSWTEGLSPKDGQGARGSSAMGATSIASLLGGGGGLPTSNAAGGRMPGLNAILQNDDVFQQIEEEIRRLTAGESPQNALLQQLGL